MCQMLQSCQADIIMKCCYNWPDIYWTQFT